MYASWRAFDSSIGRPAGSDEDAVRRTRATALELQPLLASLHAPPAARLFHEEMQGVVKNVLTVIEDRLRLAVAQAQKGSAGAPPDLQQIRNEAGTAFYFVKQTFPDAMAQLRILEAVRR
jgi:hypothetical protein